MRQQTHSFRFLRIGFGWRREARESGLSNVQRCVQPKGGSRGTSIIEVGLLRPAAAPGGRRVEGSRLGVAIVISLHHEVSKKAAKAEVAKSQCYVCLGVSV